jgi:hypothetical protein
LRSHLSRPPDEAYPDDVMTSPVGAGIAAFSRNLEAAGPFGTGWAMGSAGIIRELLRFSRVTDGADPSYAITWPDHHPAGPGH